MVAVGGDGVGSCDGEVEQADSESTTRCIVNHHRIVG
jgi:hypothetical protein